MSKNIATNESFMSLKNQTVSKMEMFMLFLCLVVGCAMNTEAKQVKMEVLKGVALDFHQLDPSILNGIEEHEVRITPFNDKQHLLI